MYFKLTTVITFGKGSVAGRESTCKVGTAELFSIEYNGVCVNAKIKIKWVIW